MCYSCYKCLIRKICLCSGNDGHSTDTAAPNETYCSLKAWRAAIHIYNITNDWQGGCVKVVVHLIAFIFLNIWPMIHLKTEGPLYHPLAKILWFIRLQEFLCHIIMYHYLKYIYSICACVSTENMHACMRLCVCKGEFPRVHTSKKKEEGKSQSKKSDHWWRQLHREHCLTLCCSLYVMFK